MIASADGHFKRCLLCIVPPYGNRPPAGCAYLLGYLKANDCYDFDFLDLRLGAPLDFTPTYRTTGTFGESYVLDVPDLPLVLQILQGFEENGPLFSLKAPWFERYCLERSLSSYHLASYLTSLASYLEMTLGQIPEIDFIGFSTWTPNFLSTLIAAAILKRRSKPPVIVAGGPQVTSSAASAELALRAGLFDAVVLGEGEGTLLELYRQFRKSGSVANVSGTVTFDRHKQEFSRSTRRSIKLESLPVPSFDEIPLSQYQDDRDHITLPFQLSRGCTDKCSFCSEWVFWRQYRTDTSSHAVEQLEYLLKRHNGTFVEFADSLLNGSPNRLRSFAEEVVSRDLEFGWTSFMRAQMDAETAGLLAKAGCNGVFIGVESFSDEALALMRKRRTEAQNIQAIIAFVEAGIRVTAGFIPGFPGDSRAGFMHSVTVLRELQSRYPGMIGLHEEPFTVMAGAPIMDRMDEMGLMPVMWDQEYLDIYLKGADIASRVVCSVTGREQGLERLGRASLVGAVKSDIPVRAAFQEGFDEEIRTDLFTFTHLGRVDIHKTSMNRAASHTKPAKFFTVFS